MISRGLKKDSNLRKIPHKEWQRDSAGVREKAIGFDFGVAELSLWAGAILCVFPGQNPKGGTRRCVE